MEKRIYITLLFGIIGHYIFAQSNQLKSSFQEVASILKEYKFQSEDVRRCDYEMYETKSITLTLSNGNFVFTLIDKFIDCGSFSESHPGTKIITVPIK